MLIRSISLIRIRSNFLLLADNFSDNSFFNYAFLLPFADFGYPHFGPAGHHTFCAWPIYSAWSCGHKHTWSWVPQGDDFLNPLSEWAKSNAKKSYGQRSIRNIKTNWHCWKTAPMCVNEPVIKLQNFQLLIALSFET